MTIYKVKLNMQDGSNRGFLFAGSEAEAREEHSKLSACNPLEDFDKCVVPFCLAASKGDIVRILNQHAAHPDP